MGNDAGKFNFCLLEQRRTPLHLGDARQSSVAARPTGDIVPAARSAREPMEGGTVRAVEFLPLLRRDRRMAALPLAVRTRL